MTESKQGIIASLNIADTFTLAMDEEIRQDGLSGSLCGFALELNQAPDSETLKQRIDEFSHQFPTALASLQQRGKHFFWCKRDNTPQLFFQHHTTDEQSFEPFQKQIINQLINQKQTRESITPIEFHLISHHSKATFFIRWIHPFCDARGIDLILKFLLTESDEQRLLFCKQNSKPLVNIQLDKYRWWKKVVLLLKGKRYVASIDKQQSIQAFDTSKAPEQLNYSVQRLDAHQTIQVNQLARKYVGLTGTSLYYIGCLMRALDKLNPNAEGEAYCAPYAFNLRKQRVLTPVVANHVCALFAQVPREVVQDREQLFNYLKEQNKEVIRNKLDYAFLPLMWAGSWLSLDEYGKILRLSSSGNERSSFWFSDIGKVDINKQDFLGTKIDSIFHLCQVTTPPAFALLCSVYKEQLTLSYSFVEPIVNLEQIKELQKLLLIELLEEEQ